MGITKELWLSTIQEQLFKDNAFIKTLTDHSAFIMNSTVHIPQAGAAANIVKNRSSLPGTITQRTDTDLTYSLDYFTSDPILLPMQVDQYELAYDKRASILRTNMLALEEAIANNALYQIAPTSQSRIIRTTGALSSTALSSGATGSRSAVTLSDIARLNALLDSDNVPREGRKLVVSSDLYNTQLLLIPEVAQAQMFGSANLPSGVVSRVLGFDVIVRSTVVSFGTGATPSIKSVDDGGNIASCAATDNLAILAYHPAFVSNGTGSIDMFVQENAPSYYGSIFSFGVQHGASRMRTDQKGIAALVQQ